MKYRGKKYEEDIQQLIKLKSSSPNSYKEFMTKVCREHKVSYATVRRDMNKKITGFVPGMNKTRRDVGIEKKPISMKEKKMMKELVKSKGKKESALRELEKLTGEKITMHKKLKLNKAVQKLEDSDEDSETNFGSEARKFINKLFELNLIAPENGLKFKFKNINIFITKDELNDIALILANAYNRKAEDRKLIAVDRISLLKNELFYTINEMHRIAKTKMDVKAIEACSRMFVRLDSNKSMTLPNDFEIYFKAMQSLKPEISKEEAIDILISQIPEE